MVGLFFLFSPNNFFVFFEKYIHETTNDFLAIKIFSLLLDFFLIFERIGVVFKFVLCSNSYYVVHFLDNRFSEERSCRLEFGF